MPQVPWNDFLAQDYSRDYKESERLCLVVDPDEEPYKSKEEAIALLQKLKEKVELYLPSAKETADEGAVVDHLAFLNLRIGSVAIETEQWGVGGPLVESAVLQLEKKPESNLTSLQDGYNTLGILWCNREDHSVAEKWLKKSEELYLKRDCTNESHDDKCSRQSKYRQTLFYLAQVYGHLGQPDRSAEYCGSTLEISAKSFAELDCADWAQNAAQLAGYYVGQGEFHSAERCLAAASAVMELDKSEAAEVLANIQLARGKLFAHQLKVSRDCAMNSINISELDSPADTRFSFQELNLAAPVPETGLLVDTFADALKLFNLAMPNFREAAKYYILDGFVTEHINILMDVSGLYKHLAHFEPDTHRQCVMHRKRCKPLEPLQKTLNPKAFDGQWKGIHFELGETFRTIMEIKKDTGRPHVKALEAGSKALFNYNVFLAAVEEGARIQAGKAEGAEESKELIRVDKDEENMYLSARFCRARVYQKLQPETEGGGPPDTTNLKLALDEFEALLAYAKKFKVQTFKDELDICQQMAELLPTKLNNMHRQ